MTSRTTRPHLLRVLVAASALLVASATAAFEPLPRTTPEELGVDPAALAAGVASLGRAAGARSVVILCRGNVVTEARWAGLPTSLDDVRSVTKSVTSTLVGIAVDHGFIGSIDDRMVDYLPPSLIPADPAKNAITLRHLLTMTSGLQWNESTDLFAWMANRNPARFILDRPVVNTPGSHFNYSTAASHLLSVVLGEASGMDPLAFADAYLLAPLGITDREWLRDPQGRPFGSIGLQLRTEDLAKLGVLFLRSGSWRDDTIVPPAWVYDAVSVHSSGFQTYGPLSGIGYGYLWWSGNARSRRVVIAWGWGGQFVFCAPALDLVVATTARWEVFEDVANQQETAILGVIVNEIMPLFPARASPRLRVGGHTSLVSP